MKIKVIRYADEGFVNYPLKLNINNKIQEIEGCHAFVKKVFKGALQYNFTTTLKDRVNDKKNILSLNNDIKVYARKFNPNNISLRGDKCSFLELKNNKIYENDKEYLGKVVYTDFNVNWGFNDTYTLMSLKEVYNQITKYENLLKNIKELGYKVKKKDISYIFYEIILNINQIK